MSYTHELKDNRWLECVQSNSNVFADLVTYRPPQVTHWSDDVRLELLQLLIFAGRQSPVTRYGREHSEVHRRVRAVTTLRSLSKFTENVHERVLSTEKKFGSR